MEQPVRPTTVSNLKLNPEKALFRFWISARSAVFFQILPKSLTAFRIRTETLGRLFFTPFRVIAAARRTPGDAIYGAKISENSLCQSLSWKKLKGKMDAQGPSGTFSRNFVSRKNENSRSYHFLRALTVNMYSQTRNSLKTHFALLSSISKSARFFQLVVPELANMDPNFGGLDCRFLE